MFFLPLPTLLFSSMLQETNNLFYLALLSVTCLFHCTLALSLTSSYVLAIIAINMLRSRIGESTMKIMKRMAAIQLIRLLKNSPYYMQDDKIQLEECVFSRNIHQKENKEKNILTKMSLKAF